MMVVSPAAEITDRFKRVIDRLDARFKGQSFGDDEKTEKAFLELSLRKWLDGPDRPLNWTYPVSSHTYPHITEDEWFFITNLYGLMTLQGQRTHIRRFYPSLFVQAAKRDIRNFVPHMPEYAGLRAPWMKNRLCVMADLLSKRSISMTGYVEWLRKLDRAATPENLTPALDAILRDHKAQEGKTLSVFVRDCVRGRCFPVDSRVRNVLKQSGLPDDETILVSLSLSIGRNPRQVARMSYEAGGLG